MTVIPTVHIPARELHLLLDLAGMVPSRVLTDGEFEAADALTLHWRNVAYDVQPQHTNTYNGRPAV